MALLDIATILCIGLLAGVELAVSVFVNPIVWRLERSAQATATRLFAERLGRVMPSWYFGSLVLLAAEAAMHWHRSGDLPLIAASMLWLIVIVLTVVLLVPINNRMATLYPANFTEQEQAAHRRWDALHRLRIAAVALCLLLLLIALHL